MIFLKIGRYARRLKKSAKYIFTMWFPAVILLIFFVILGSMVATSKSGSFKACGQQLYVCMGDEIQAKTSFHKMIRLTSCAYQTAWCDTRVVWGMMTGNDYFPPDANAMVETPEVDEKADKELFDKLTSDEYLDEQFKTFEKLPPADEKIENTQELMEKARQERLKFENEQSEKLKHISIQQNLSGQND